MTRTPERFRLRRLDSRATCRRTDTDVQTALDTIDAAICWWWRGDNAGNRNRAWRGERRDGSPGDCKQRHNDSWVDKQPHTPNSRRRAPSGYCCPSHSSDRYRPIGVDGNTVTRTCNCCTPDDDADGYRQRYDGSQGGYRRVDCCQCRRGGGGGGTADRIVLADAVGVSNTAGPHEITLTEAMVARQWISFFAFTTAGASPDGIGYLLSDDILALTAEATAPTNAENALPVVTGSYSASNFTQQSGNYFVFRKDDSTLWIRPTRLTAHALTITATPMGGGALTSAEQTSLSNARVLRSREFIGIGNGIATHDSDVEWPTNSPNTFVVTATEYADVERIELLLRQNGKADLPFVITKGLAGRHPRWRVYAQ